MNSFDKSKIRFGAVGDLLLNTRPGADAPGRGLEALSEEVRNLFATCDIVLANLECTLPGPKTVPTEPRVVSTEKQVRSLRHSGVGIVTLGNNHMFDCLDEGFNQLTDVLDDLKMPWFGAGMDLEAAERPKIMTVQGIRLAFLGGVAPSTGARRFAGEAKGGVAPLDMDRLRRNIAQLRDHVDHVIVSPHWGRERFRIPSPEQVIQARALIDAGASMVLGHHPHVLQGMELYQGLPIVYSFGNFLANDVYWQDGDFFTWTRFERTSCILLADLSADRVENVRQIPVFDDGQTVYVEKSGWGEKCLGKVNGRLHRGVTARRYNREKTYVEKIKPIISHLRWAEMKRLRPRHFVNAVKLLLR